MNICTCTSVQSYPKHTPKHTHTQKVKKKMTENLESLKLTMLVKKNTVMISKKLST